MKAIAAQCCLIPPPVCSAGKPLLSLLCAVVLTATAKAEWHAGGYIGAAHTQSSSLELNQPALGTSAVFDGVRYEGNSFQSPLYYGIRGGYFFHRHFGAEIEFIHLKVFAKVNRTVQAVGAINGTPVNSPVVMSSVVQRFSISHGNNLLLANAVLRQDFFRPGNEKLGRLIIYGKFGAGATIPHAESTIFAVADEHYQVGRPAIQLAGGAEVRLWRKLYWMAEYKFTRNRQRVDVPSGTAESLLLSHHGVTGIDIHF